MEIEIRLSKLLEEYNLLHRGTPQRMADEIGVHRHTIRKLLANQLSNPGLDTLGFVCEWLVKNGVPRDRLPHDLFGARPSGLWQAVSASGVVCLYVGEYHQIAPPARTRRWIAQHDAVAMANVVQWLSGAITAQQHNLNVTIEYVPFRFVQGVSHLREEHLREDRRTAERIFRQMAQTGSNRSSILLGSQRANHVVEMLVADLFGCRPFAAPGRTPRVPFYLTYRDDDRSVPSCFGGRDAPPWCKNATGPGIYYQDETRQWTVLPWKEREQDAGLIIILRDLGTTALQMAMFGFSGWGTEQLGGQLLRDTRALWPLPVHVERRQIGVYLCRFVCPPHAGGDVGAGASTGPVEIIQLDGGVLTDYLR